MTAILALWALGSCALALRAGVRQSASERAAFFVLFWPLCVIALVILAPLYAVYALGRLASGAAHG